MQRTDDLERGTLSGKAPADDDTLTEPVSVTFKRDVSQVYVKLWMFLSLEREDAVMVRAEVVNYELWGPFIFTIAFATLLVARQKSDFEQVFSVVVTFIAIGALILTLNTQLLKAPLTLSQGLCIAGYTAFPLLTSAFGAVVLAFLPRFIAIALVGVGVAWSVKSAHRVMRCLVTADRELAATYPFALFHLALGWFVFVCS